MENTIFNWIIGIIVTILLGAVGSGFWEIMLKPVLRYISFKSMSLTTFFFKKWRNYTYKSVGSTIKPINIASVSFSLIIYIIFSFILIINYQTIENDRSDSFQLFDNIILKISPDQIHKEYLKEGDKLTFFENFILNIVMNNDYYQDIFLQKIKLIKDDSEKYKKIDGDEKEILAKHIIKIIKEARMAHRNSTNAYYICNVIFFIMFPVIFISVFYYFIFFPFIYINETGDKFMQCLDICTPYITPSYRDLILSKFRQITSREDFITLADELQKIAEKEKLIFPKYKIW